MVESVGTLRNDLTKQIGHNCKVELVTNRDGMKSREVAKTKGQTEGASKASDKK
jgi:hypothetical protein